MEDVNIVMEMELLLFQCNLCHVEVICEICEGKRYNDETLQVKFKEKNNC